VSGGRLWPSSVGCADDPSPSAPRLAAHLEEAVDEEEEEDAEGAEDELPRAGEVRDLHANDPEARAVPVVDARLGIGLVGVGVGMGV